MRVFYGRHSTASVSLSSQAFASPFIVKSQSFALLFSSVSHYFATNEQISECACVCRRRWCIPRIIFCASFRWWLCRWKIFRCDFGTSTSCHDYDDSDDAPVVAQTPRTNKNMNWCLPIWNCVAVSNRAELKLETRLWLLLLLFEQQEKGVQQPLTRFGWQRTEQQPTTTSKRSEKNLRIVKCVNGWCGAVLLLVFREPSKTDGELLIDLNDTSAL